MAQAEADANRRVLDWLNENKPGADDLTSLNQIPAAILEGIAPAMRAALYDRVEATRDRSRNAIERGVAMQARELQDRALLNLYAMSEDELSRTDLRQYVGIVPASTLGPWIARQRKATGGGGKGLSPDRVAAMIDSLGKDFGASRKPGASSSKRTLWTDVANYTEQQLAGKADSEISREDLRAVVLNGLSEAQIAGTGWFGSDYDNDTVPRAQIGNAKIDLDDIPPEAIAKIRKSFEQSGNPNPTTQDIFDVYRRAVARGRVP